MVAACGGLRNLSDHPRLQIVLALYVLELSLIDSAN
jgi:hypothetical protein